MEEFRYPDIDEVFIDDSNYMTIYRSKGKEFESVLVNGEPFAKEKNFALVSKVLNNPVIISDTTDERNLLLRNIRGYFMSGTAGR